MAEKDQIILPLESGRLVEIRKTNLPGKVCINLLGKDKKANTKWHNRQLLDSRTFDLEKLKQFIKYCEVPL